MGDRSPYCPVLVISALLALVVALGAVPGARAGHDLGQNCYTCHNIEAGQVWSGSYSIWASVPIGMSPYSRPITCDVCHPDYGASFRATSESHHPVAVIADNTMSSDYDNGVVIRCKDCHNADSVTLSPNLHPDLAPTHYNGVAGNDNVDGYPNHDVTAPNNLLSPGDPPHLLAMLLSGGQRTVSGSGTYSRLPSSAPATDYAFCLSCHDGSANTARAVNVRQDYIDKGHYFKLTNAGQGITAGDRMPCSDCHASHSSGTNARLFEPDNATFAGTRPTNLRFASPYAPTNAETRAICNFCHDDYNAANTGNGTPTVRTVEPTPRRYGIAGHAPADTQSCKQCHNPHKTPGGGPDCLTCHTSGGAAGATYNYIDALFKGVGSDNGVARPGDAPPMAWSQHGGFNGNAPYFIYQSPFNTKASNDCVKCHGDRHNNTYKLIDADLSDSFAFDNSAASLRTTTQANANAFCLTCHDGNGSDADVRVGGTSAPPPPNVAATWATRGHGLTSGVYSVSGNNAANIKCIDCHEIHGSNHAKLLPADNTATGNFAMPAGKPGMTFRGGAGTLLASAVDFNNHSLPASGDTYGTTGNPGGLTSAPQGYTGTATTGLCDACHRYSGTPPAGTISTYNKAHTHEGIAGQGNPASQMTFTKDCVECHNPHGGANANVYMIHDNITVTQAAGAGTYPVTFTDNTRFDPSGTGNALCNVCHVSPSQDAALNVSHNYRTTTVSPDHAEGTNCAACHAHGRTDNAARVGFPQGSCASCHGNDTDGTFWPADTTGGAAYPNRSGAHVKHINAIYNANSGTLPGATPTAKKNATCTWCHPGNPPPGHYTDETSGPGQAEVIHMDNIGNGFIGPPTSGDYWSYAEGATATSGTAVRFRTISGANDNDAFYLSNAMKACSNVDCHSGTLTPNWFTGERYDTTPPVWAGGVSGIAASDLAQGGAVGVSWNTATDTGPPSSQPVQYTLYWSTSADTVFTAGTFMDNLATTSATVTGLSNLTTYYFGVRAKDSASPANATTNTDNVSATPTASASQSQTVGWKLKKSQTYTVYTGAATNLGTACGSAVAIAASGTYNTIPVPGRGLLTTGALTCPTPSTANFVYNSSPATTEEQFVAFYTDNTYPIATLVNGNASGTSVGIMSSTANPHTIRVRLAGVTAAGAHTLSTSAVTQTVASITNGPYLLNLSSLSVTVPAGGRLAVIFTWQDYNTTMSSNDHIMMDNTGGGFEGVVSVTETPIDTLPPVFNGDVSGITVTATGSGDSLQVSWNQALDALTPPVRYDLYRSTVPASLWSAPYRTNLGTTSIVDSGLAQGTTYYYGVRAKDSVTPTPNVTTNIDNASGTPGSGAPVWTGGVSGIVASDLAQGGAVAVVWNTATDADNPPVQYTLYWSTSAATVFTAGTFMDNLAATSATVTGLSNGTTYYFGVRAKDCALPCNQTANTDNVSATPSAPPPPGSKVYYLDKPSIATTLWGTTSTNLSTTCPGATTNLAVSAAPGGATWPGTLPGPAAPPAGRGILSTTRVCATTGATNYMASNTTAWNAAWRLFGGFYTSPYAADTIVSGSASGNNFGFRSASATEDVRILFAAVDSAGNHTVNTASYVEQLNIGTTMTAYAPNLSTLSVTVPAGSRFAVLIYYYDTSTTGSANHQIAYDSYSAAITDQVTVTETLIDAVPPVFNGGVSGITASSTGSGDSLQVSWNTAVDALTPPVRYDLYRSMVLANLWSALYRTDLGTTSIIDSGLTQGATYYYGVRAKDSVIPTPNVTTNIDNASGIPLGSDGSSGCNSCHVSPPASPGNAGSHARHVGTGDYDGCNKCHPGVTNGSGTLLYTNGHQDGIGQLGFSGTAYNGDYTGGQLTYRDGSSAVFYQDASGYGILTGSAGDNTDNGTCFGTPANTCHGNGSTNPVWGGTLAGGCGDCHNATGKQAASAPTVTMTNSHTTAPGGAGVCGDCHAGHYQGVRIPLPPGSWSDPSGRLTGQNMQTRLGLDYASTGGVHLGGASGSGVVASIAGKTTEAEICWNCHRDVGGANTYGVSEWGYNTKTSPAGYPVVYTTFPTQHDGTSERVDFGWLYANSSYSWSQRTADWTAGYWMDEYDPLIKRRIASAHSASFDAAGQSSSVAFNVGGGGAVNRTSPVLENRSYLRCSYCHDVHDLNRAQGDASSGQPFLRGTWIGNPYPPELPPRAAGTSSLGQTYTYTTGVNAGSGATTPRGRSTARDRGGYFIDQNSGWPTDNTAMDSLAKTAGLCTICHGTDVDTMKFYTGSTLWRTGMANGHSNSTLGGTGANKRDIFSVFRYPTAMYGDSGMGVQYDAGATPYQCDTSNGSNCDPGYPQSTWTTGNDPGVIIVNSGWYGGTPGTYARGAYYSSWYPVPDPPPPSGTIAGAQGPGSMAHKFTCSKCHSPHATGLPALLTHNCVDPLPVASGGFQINGYDGKNIAANNCHRKTTTTDGWHKLAPGQ